MVKINSESREAAINKVDGSLGDFSDIDCTKSFAIASKTQNIIHIKHIPRLGSHFAIIDYVLNTKLVNLANQSHS